MTHETGLLVLPLGFLGWLSWRELRRDGRAALPDVAALWFLAGVMALGGWIGGI